MLQKRHRVIPLFTLLSLGGSGAGCDELVGTKSCSDVGCNSELSLSITRPGSAWADGDYQLDLHLDGELYRCPFTLPIPGKLPHELQLNGEPFDCTPALPDSTLPHAIALYPEPDQAESCRTRPDAGSQPPLASCPPLDGRYHIELHTSRIPALVELRLALADQVLLDLTRQLQYTRIEPNGAGCGPICYQAELDYRIDEPE